MSVNYSFNQRLAIIKLQYKHDNETFGKIRDRYNFLSIKNPGRPKSATDENSAASI